MPELGDFLRSRRASLGPADVGLVSVGQRRVPGLRREEVAQLAGVSIDYYIRLEQGRERSPSVQVVDALATALRLDDDAREHLFRLAGQALPAPGPHVPDRVDPALLQLMAAWPDNPALVYNRAYDVLAANPIAEALFGDFGAHGNLMTLVFNEPRAREFYADWPRIAANSVAGFRRNHGEQPNDPRVVAVLTELLATSADFAQLWARHDVRGKTQDTKVFRHPEVGMVTLGLQTFAVRSAPGQELVVYQAAPGSPSADAVKMLGSLAASHRI
ncbi:helix-turn-helix domain-containing protein [Mycolicibacterium neoaurum]|uniref:helix-turn-helix transcriptional regulator n=1 Tax=Mycolicibacterium neoaurum TaxID=1795 RepID=UPI001BCE16AF|nr:helix-turn-helix transcriptional regulator [Mycolicibacterium neoaurum]QVI30326.1 helix-turn-helix domain-containing protein [Mycolicibacterium neoaurum]